ncbi:MAG: sigma-E factor regulatory protein RseB domain-containing protein [Candidatus Sericytochromatia bacterium]|nr:sigma-E factor regulatory protein RseB domain-containing protein [Candidatus Sericytochromatia bacterium]
MRWRRSLGLLWFFGLSGLAGPGQVEAAPLTPDAILRARETLHYSGLIKVTTFSERGEKVRRLRVTQVGSRGTRQEFLDAQGHLSDLVTVNGGVRWHYAPRQGKVTVSATESEGSLSQRLALVKRNYDFRVLGQLRHLQRLTLLAQFRPRQHGNLTHRLWVDQLTRLPLVVERRDEQGRLVDRSEFLSLRLNPVEAARALTFQLPAAVKVQSQNTMLARGDAATPLPVGLTWRPPPPRQLPAGYALIQWQYFLDHRQVPTFAWRFHDGLALLSCFATDARSQARRPAEGQPIRIGGHPGFALQHGHKRLLSWQQGPTAYTLVGECPEAWLNQVAENTP